MKQQKLEQYRQYRIVKKPIPKKLTAIAWSTHNYWLAEVYFEKGEQIWWSTPQIRYKTKEEVLEDLLFMVSCVKELKKSKSPVLEIKWQTIKETNEVWA